MLNGNLAGPQHALQLRDIEPEDGHGQSEEDGGEEVEVLGGVFLYREKREVGGGREGGEGRVLEEGEAAGAEGEEGEHLPIVWGCVSMGSRGEGRRGGGKRTSQPD